MRQRSPSTGGARVQTGGISLAMGESRLTRLIDQLRLFATDILAKRR